MTEIRNCKTKLAVKPKIKLVAIITDNPHWLACDMRPGNNDTNTYIQTDFFNPK